MATDRSEIERLLGQQDRLTAQLRRAFLEAIDRAGSAINLKHIADLLRLGQAAQAAAEIDAIVRSQALGQFATAAENAVLSAARSAAGSAVASAVRRGSNLGRYEAVFSVTNPQATMFLQRYRFNLIREMSQEVRRTVGATIQAGTTDGRNPRDVARDIKEQIGLTRRQAAAVRNYRRMLESGDSAALQRALRDKRFDGTVARAARGEKTLTQEQIDGMVQRYRQRYLKYRAQTIARTEAIRGLNVGNWLAWHQAAEEGTVDRRSIRRKWVFTHDRRTREAHREIPGMNPNGVTMDQPFKTPLGPLMYPGDVNGAPGNTINCRCTQIIRYSAGG